MNYRNFSVFLSTLLLAACATTNTHPSVAEIDGPIVLDAFSGRLTELGNVLIVDARLSDEPGLSAKTSAKVVRIPYGAKIPNMTTDEAKRDFANEVKKVWHGETIVIICSQGVRSLYAADALRSLMPATKTVSVHGGYRSSAFEFF